MKTIKKVHFSKIIQVYKYDYSNSNKLKNRKLRRYNQLKNRKLRGIERYMRKNHLLTKNEYLCLQNESCKHIRGDFINHISNKQKWIQCDEYLKIIY